MMDVSTTFNEQVDHLDVASEDSSEEGGPSMLIHHVHIDVTCPQEQHTRRRLRRHTQRECLLQVVARSIVFQQKGHRRVVPSSCCFLKRALAYYKIIENSQSASLYDLA